MRRSLKGRIAAALASLAITLTATASTFTAPVVSAGNGYNYAEALQLSLYLYDANKCGAGIADGALTWRKDCHTFDAKYTAANTNLPGSITGSYGQYLDPDGDGYIDLSGGYHDAGDFVKFNLPAAYSCSTLAWGAYEFKDSFVQTKTMDHLLEILKWFGDYFIKCTFLDGSGKAFAYCYQVGEGGPDHSKWRAPELDTTSTVSRKAYFVTSSNKSSDQCYEAAAALDSAALIFKDYDADYSAKLIKYAKALYQFGKDCGGQITNEACSGFYNSESWQDDMAWAACWMFLATGDSSYKSDALQCKEYCGWFHSWAKVMLGYFEIANEIGITPSTGNISTELNNLKNSYTKSSGYICGTDWGSARYNTAWNLAALAYINSSGSTDLLPSVTQQMEYLLGKNNNGLSYLIGYGSKYPQFPHHRGSAQNLSTSESTDKQKYVLWGALVGGPDGNGTYLDITDKYQYSEVAIDYNAAMVGALAGMYKFAGSGDSTRDLSGISEINAGYKFYSGGGGGSEEPFMLGDVTGDKKINVQDVAKLAKAALNLVTLTDTEKKAGDVTGDGKINVQDVAKLAKVALNLITL